MTDKRKSQPSTHKMEDLTVKLLLLNRVNTLSLDSECSEENGTSSCHHLCSRSFLLSFLAFQKTFGLKGLEGGSSHAQTL